MRLLSTLPPARYDFALSWPEAMWMPLKSYWAWGRDWSWLRGTVLSCQVRSDPSRGSPTACLWQRLGTDTPTQVMQVMERIGCDPSLLSASSRAGPPWASQHRKHPYACPPKDQSRLHNVLWQWVSQIKLFPMWKEGVTSHILSLFQLNEWCYKCN